jgi:Flp pilus assembly protein TadG
MKTLRVRWSSAVRRRLRDFGGNRSGNVAIVFALSAVVLMLGIGAAVDIGRWLHARDKTLAAIDAAVLAGARALQLDDADTDVAVAQAQKFYDENVTKRLPVTDDTVTFGVADDGQSVTASGSAYIKTPFLQFANIDKLPLISTATAEFSSAGYGTSEDLEIALMLDVTGSMQGQKLADLKKSAKDLIEIIETQSGSGYTTKMALVPFSEDIRLPTTNALNKARGNNLPDTKTISNGWWGNTTYYLSDCVVERTGSQKYTDAAPANGQYALGHYTQNYTQSGKKTGVCTIPQDSAIQPLSDDTEMLKGKVDDLSASGGTAGHLGTAWAWYTLSPNWNALWPEPNRAADYGTPHLTKIAILMTDGEYNTQYDSNGIAASDYGAANGSSTQQARALCTSMKNAGIIVYSIGFELSGPSSQSYQTLKNCASDETKFYDAEDGVQLQQAFRDIGLKLSKLYLSK